VPVRNKTHNAKNNNQKIKYSIKRIRLFPIKLLFHHRVLRKQIGIVWRYHERGNGIKWRNEEGKLKNKEINNFVTILFQEKYGNNDFIVGNIVLILDKELE